MKQFNFSPSSLSCYLDSPLQFFYQYLDPLATPDTPVVQCYGISGTLVHECLEDYHKSRDVQLVNQKFVEEWDKRGLNTMKGLNGKPLDAMQYQQALFHGIHLINNVYEILKTEMKIELPYRGTTKKKGFLDNLCKFNGKLMVMDWKTSASIDNKPNFRNQVLFYCHLYWCETGELITTARIEYLKLKKHKEYEFTEDEVINFEKNVLDPIMAEIEQYGMNARNYPLGDFDNPFNVHLAKCRREFFVRGNPGAIQAERIGNRLVFKSGLDEGLRTFIDYYFSFEVEGKEFIKSYQDHVWDGRKKFLKRDTLPFAFFWKVQEILDVYNASYGTSYWLDLTDKRNMEVVNCTYNTQFRDSQVKLRDYQHEALQTMFNKKIMIVFGATSFGKTLLSAEFIKRANRRTLFLVNRIELVRQTAEEYREYLGVEIGEMVEGKLDIDNQITVAGIQTLSAILKRNNAESKLLKKYLYNVTCVVADEAQGIKDSGMYEEIANELSNAEYIIGLSGSPFRNEGDTLCMNALVGFVEYEKRSKELEEEGWIVPTKTYFLSTPQNEGMEVQDYNKDYETFIVKNDVRNNLINDLVERYRSSKKILVLVKSIDHGKILNELIDDSFFLYGATSKKKRKEMYEKFKNNRDGFVMISMVTIMGTGIDIPDLDVVINASAFASDILSVQVPGRVKRRCDDPEIYGEQGKQFGVLIDFHDEGLFLPFAKKRVSMLEEFDNPVQKLHHTQWEEMEIE